MSEFSSLIQVVSCAEFFAGLYLNALIISLLIYVCIQNLQVCLQCF